LALLKNIQWWICEANDRQIRDVDDGGVEILSWLWS
jgi:hypothetical protein